jgi:hypothetical protein
VRALGRTDPDGTFYFRERPIRPYGIPVRRLGRLLDEYEADPSSYLAYDSDTGWTIRPRSRSADGLYRANASGLRSAGEYSPEPPEGLLRIGLFGDSFVHGDGVGLEASLAPLLEAALRRRGVAAEALNFGVPGYGIDQAYLRYLGQGRGFGPHVVVLGLQLENVARDANVVRVLYHPATRIPFTKPRFVLDGAGLRTVNRPALEPRRARAALSHFETSELRRYEFFYRPEDYTLSWFRSSRLLSVAADALSSEGELGIGPDPFRPEGEPARVTLAVLDAFHREAERNASRFALVYLPVRLAGRFSARQRRLDALLEAVTARFPVVDPRVGPASVEAWPPRLTGADGWHYSAEGNRRVAEALADWIALGQGGATR